MFLSVQLNMKNQDKFRLEMSEDTYNKIDFESTVIHIETTPTSNDDAIPVKHTIMTDQISSISVTKFDLKKKSLNTEKYERFLKRGKCKSIALP